MSDETTEPAEDEPLIFDLDDPDVPQAPGSAIIKLPKHMRKKADGELDPNHLDGRTIAGRYQVERELARGGMGVVYLARQDKLEREVVVKVLSRQMVGDDDARRRFDREARGMSQLQHPNLVTIYDYGTFEGLSYIVMEYVDGEPLTDVLKRRERFFWNDFLRIAIQVLDAVAEAHDAEIVHRDLKPANVMVCKRHGQDNFVKILDFGLARFRSNKEITKELFGSVAYLAPEIVRGEKIDASADIYALGVMFYEMLTGRQPFEGDDYGVMYKHVNEEPPNLEEFLPFDHLVPEAAIRLIHRSMAKDKAERPKNAGEFLQLLTAEVSRWTGILPFEMFEGGAPPRYRRIAEEAHASSPTQSGKFRTVPGSIGVTAETRRDERTPVPAPAPAAVRSGISPGMLAIAVVASLAVGALLFSTMQSRSNDTAPPPVEVAAEEAPFDVTGSLATVEELLAEKKFGRANALLDTLQPRLAADPTAAARAADLRDKIAIEQLVVAAEAARLDRNFGEAKDLYRKVLMRDPNNQLAIAKLSELQTSGEPAAQERRRPRPEPEPRPDVERVETPAPKTAEVSPRPAPKPKAEPKSTAAKAPKPVKAPKQKAASKGAVVKKEKAKPRPKENAAPEESVTEEATPDSQEKEVSDVDANERLRALLLENAAENAARKKEDGAGRVFVPDEPETLKEPPLPADDDESLESDPEANEEPAARPTTAEEPSREGAGGSSVGPGRRR